MSEELGKSPHAIWQPLGAPALIGDPIVQCLILIVVTSAVFLAFPGIDIWFSGLFYDPGNGFVVSRLKGFTGFRDLLRNGTAVIAYGLVAVLVIKLVWPHRKALLRPCDILFILGTLAVGPGIVTNVVFKNHWGRPRPFRVEAFGGDQPFVGVWRITDYCQTNCSFVSGEGSSAIWLLTLIVLVPERWRPTATRLLLVLAVLLSLNRVAFGGHFLSDVLLAWWITLLIMAIAYRLLYVSPPAALANDSIEAWLTEAGEGIRQGVAALKERAAAALEARRAAKAANAEKGELEPERPPEAGRPPDESP